MLGSAARATSLLGVASTLRILAGRGLASLVRDFTWAKLLFLLYSPFDWVAFRITVLGALFKCSTRGANYREAVVAMLDELEAQPRRCILATKVKA